MKVNSLEIKFMNLEICKLIKINKEYLMLRQILLSAFIVYVTATDSKCLSPGICSPPVADFSIVLNVRPR